MSYVLPNPSSKTVQVTREKNKLEIDLSVVSVHKYTNDFYKGLYLFDYNTRTVYTMCKPIYQITAFT